jgi:hypothetical protein
VVLPGIVEKRVTKSNFRKSYGYDSNANLAELI